MPEYDLDFLDEVKSIPNLRIIKCCGNCKFFVIKTGNGKQRRSYCRVFEILKRKKGLNKRARETYNNAQETNLPKVHTTTVCDLHVLRSFEHSIARVSDWVGITFNGTGAPDDL